MQEEATRRKKNSETHIDTALNIQEMELPDLAKEQSENTKKKNPTKQTNKKNHKPKPKQ